MYEEIQMKMTRYSEPQILAILRLPEIIQGVEFRDGIKHEIKAA